MTLVATLQIQGCPVAFGDLLISGPEITSQLAIPMAGDIHNIYPLGSGWSITGLQQKLCIISDHCVIGWSGTRWKAQVAINGLRDAALDHNLTLESVLTYLGECTELKDGDTSLVGWFVDGDKAYRFNVAATDYGQTAIGPLQAAGTGSSTALELATLMAQSNMHMSGEGEPGRIVVATTLGMAALLIRSEFHGGATAPTLRQFFGGGYEVALYVDGKFQKLGEFTFVIWELDVDGSNVRVGMPSFVMKQQYRGDILVLRSAKFRSDASRAGEAFDQQLWAVPPLHAVGDDQRIEPNKEDFPLQSLLFCHCVLVRCEAQYAVTWLVKQQAPDSHPSMTIADNGDNIEIGIYNTLADQLVDIASRCVAGLRGLGTDPAHSVG